MVCLARRWRRVSRIAESEVAKQSRAKLGIEHKQQRDARPAELNRLGQCGAVGHFGDPSSRASA